MKVGNLVQQSPLCFDNPMCCGIVIETRDDPMRPMLTQHNVYWPSIGARWIEEGLLEVVL